MFNAHSNKALTLENLIKDNEALKDDVLVAEREVADTASSAGEIKELLSKLEFYQVGVCVCKFPVLFLVCFHASSCVMICVRVFGYWTVYCVGVVVIVTRC